MSAAPIEERIARIRASVSLPNLLLSYGVDLKQSGNSYTARCIAHEDNNPSMSIYIGTDGAHRCYCHSCGFGNDVIDAYKKLTGASTMEALDALDGGEYMGPQTTLKATPEPPLTPAVWQSQKPPAGPRPDMALPKLTGPLQVWEYKTAGGETMGYVARYTDEAGGKTYRPWTFGTMSENVKPRWEAKIFAAPRPLYGLDRLAAQPEAKVVIVEGEKAADASQTLLPSMCGVTWPGGSNAVPKADWTPLAGRSIVLIPDADLAGENAMLSVAGYLLALGCEVRIVDSSAKPAGWDLADALADGMTGKQVAEWARENIKPVTTAGLEAQRIEAEKKRMAEKKTPAEPAAPSDDSTAAAPPLTLVPPPDNPPRMVETVTPEPAGNVIPLRAVQVREDLPMEFTEPYLADLFAEKYHATFRYTPERGLWFIWDGCRWKPEVGGHPTRKARDLVVMACNQDNARSLTPSKIAQVCKLATMKQVLALAACDERIEVYVDQWDADPFLLGTPGGIVDLKTGKLRPVTPEDAISKITAVAPERGPHPTWDMVLNHCTRGDPDMQEYYQRWAGYMLTGDCREEAFLFVHGPGGSGKSKFIDCLGDMLGDYCTTAKVEMLMESKVERHTEEIAALAGARMVRTSEPEEGARWNEALLKLLTGRDKVSARRLYEKQFQFTVQAKLVFSGNFKPALKSTGEEIRRRMHFAEFPDSIPEHERIGDLPDRLRAEWPAILQWAIDGCLEWQHRGLGRPDAVHEATTAYLADEDSLGAWIADSCVVGKDHRDLNGDLYVSYRKATEASGEFPVSQKRWSQRMEGRGYARHKSNGQRYMVGIRLATPADVVNSMYPD